MSVLYVENTGIRTPSLRKSGDMKRIVSRIITAFRSQQGFSQTTDGVCVLSPLLLPLPHNRLAKRLNTFLLKNKIDAWLEKTERNRELILISFLPTPLVKRIEEIYRPDAKIYYMADDMTGGHSEKRLLALCEQEMCESFDLVAATSGKLMKRAKINAQHTIFLPSGLDNRLTRKAKEMDLSRRHAEIQANKAKRVIGFIGGIGTSDDKIDQELISYLVKKLSDCRFVFAGRVYARIPDLANAKNVVLLGHISHLELDKVIEEMAIGIIPYRVNDYTESVHPCKVYEYLAYGIPVVSTCLKEVVQINDRANGILKLARSPEEFAQGIHDELNRPDCIEDLEARLDTAIANSWAARYKVLSRAIEEIVWNKQKNKEEAQPSLRLRTWLREYSSRIRRRRLAMITSIAAIVFVLYGPLLKQAELGLIMKDIPKEIDTLLVLVGDGEGSYFNDALGNRVNDIKIADNIYSIKKIVVSSTRLQMEIDFMAEYIRNEYRTNGVRVFALKTQSNNTADHLAEMLASGVLKDSQDVMVISGPLHERRAVYILDKLLNNGPGKKINVYANGQKRRTKGKELTGLRGRIAYLFELSYEYTSLLKHVLFKESLLR
jgi:glycosyltransferase involved in cell wall biosynthesis